MEMRHTLQVGSIKSRGEGAGHLAIAHASLFNGLSVGTLGRLSAATSESSFRRGSVVFGRGATATGIHVVASGQLKLCFDTPQGAEHVVELAQPGDSFGEAALLTHQPHQLSAIAVSDCKLLHVGRHALMAELEQDPEFARRVISALGERLYRQTSALESVLFLKASGRVARFILACLKSNSLRPGQNPSSVKLPVSKGLIASHLNMTQEHFSRTLREMTAAGLIRVDGVKVDVLEIDRLHAAAGGLPAPEYARAAE